MHLYHEYTRSVSIGFHSEALTQWLTSDTALTDHDLREGDTVSPNPSLLPIPQPREKHCPWGCAECRQARRPHGKINRFW